MFNPGRLADTDAGKFAWDGSDYVRLLADLTPAVTELIAAVERFRARPRDGRDGSVLRAELMQLRYACDLLELEFADAAAEFNAMDEAEWTGSASPVDWIRHECRMSRTAASTAVAVGEMTARLPESTQAVRDGRIGHAHLALIARVADDLRGSATATSGFDEKPLLDQALEHSVGRFRFDCAHARHAADAAAMLADHVNAVTYRRLELTPCGRGALAIRGMLDSAGGATLRAALEPLARRNGAHDDRGRDRRLADALVELAGHRLDSGELPQRGSVRPHVQVTTTMETLLGLKSAPAGELEFSPPIPAATVQRLACDASITRVLLRPDSAVIDVGRALRLPSGATRKALKARDGGCAWPGCDRPASWTVAHHVVHWVFGGPTDLKNLVLLCYRHHWLVHEGGWQLVRTDDGRLLAVAPVHDVLSRARAPDQHAAA